MPILFCNIAWMEEYAGRNKNDPPKGGGGYVVSEGKAGEELNFVIADDNYVYGHFETIKNGSDREVKIERLGASKSADFIDGVDVIWTAPFEGSDRRCVVGWYKNARVYRQRQKFDGDYPSDQHQYDQINSFRVRAHAENVHLVPIPERKNLCLQRGKGWSGQASWWFAGDTESADAKIFVNSIRDIIHGKKSLITYPPVDNHITHNGKRAGQAASDAYKKYIKEYEMQINPKHSTLEKQFKKFLKKTIPKVEFLETYRDDMRYVDQQGNQVMVEVKPTEPSTLRYAIRTAIGQLLDYRQQQRWRHKQLIVVETEITRAEDKALALENGFGLAWPDRQNSFRIIWPDESTL